MKSLTIFISIIFASCLFGQDNIDTELKQLLSIFDKNQIEIDKTSPEKIAEIFQFSDIDTIDMSNESQYENYYIDKSFRFYQQKLNVIAYNTFYNDDAHEEARNASENTLQYLIAQFGHPDNLNAKEYNNWTKTNFEISYNIFNDGYSFYIDSYIENPYETVLDTLCSPDFYALRDDLVYKIITNIANGKIKIGETSKVTIEELTGDPYDFNYYYNGINVAGYFSYNDNILTSISLNYFYTCQAAMDLLSLDKTELGTEINATLNITGENTDTSSDAGKIWKIKGQTLSQSNFSDGYSFSFN